MNKPKHYEGRDSSFNDSTEADPSESTPQPYAANVEQLTVSGAEEVFNLPKTDEALSKVIEAAAHNRATEKLFELKHEIKDNASNNQKRLKQEPTHIGELINARNSAYAAQAQPTTAGIHQNSGLLNRVLKSNSLYSHAIRYGFISAILALSIAILVTLII